MNPADREAFAAAREVCRRHARSFYFASHFLPRPRREAAYAVYAFCRQMDDAVDEAASAEQARQNLSDVERRLRAVYANDSVATRLDLAFQRTVQTYDVPMQPFLDLLAGCEMDLFITRYAAWPDLELYCYRVAGCVGLVMSRLFGLQNDAAERQAVLMGNAMQLTNVLRDVGEDYATRGRVYLPGDELEQFGYSVDQLARGIVNTAFVELMRFQIARARRMFREAADGLCWLANDGSRLTATTMAVIYSGILDAIERQGYDVFSRRARLSLPQKLARLPRCWKLSRREAGEAMPDIFDR